MLMKENTLIKKPIKIETAFLCFGIGTILLYFATRLAIPFLTSVFDMRNIIAWFLSAGVLLFFPLFMASIIAYKIDGREFLFKPFLQRMRLNKMSSTDWKWAAGGIVFNFVAMGLIQFLYNYIGELTGLFGQMNPSPPFLQYTPLQSGEYWILLAWLPMFFFNIFGEELFWHGYLLQGQELVSGDNAWIINASFWLMFHIPFGLPMLLMLFPLIFSITYIIQKRQNTWHGIIIHGAINGSGFLAISLGVIH